MAFEMTNPLLNDKRFVPESPEDKAGWASPIGDNTKPPVDNNNSQGPHLRYMTPGGTLRATVLLWALVVASGVFGWTRVSQVALQVTQNGLVPFPPGTSQSTINAAIANSTAVSQVDFPAWVLLPVVFGFGFAIWATLKPSFSPVLAPLYALCYGVAVGAISAVYELQFSGIVSQAVLGTLAVFGVMLFLYASRIIKVTRKFTMMVVGSTLGILLMYLVGFVARLFGVDLMFFNQPTILGIGISGFICVVAALNLALDFAFIERASAARMPTYMNWLGALGVTVTIVWLYLQMLRLLSLLRGR